MTRKNISLYSPRLPVSGSSPRRDTRPVMHRARLVVPITQPAIANGAVVVADGVILGVGPFKLIRRQWLEAPARDHGETVLLPALVNGHAHLDLSGLAGQVSPKGSMAEWIRCLLAVRESVDEEELMIDHAREALTNGQEEVSLAAHAPYTTSAALIKAVKAWGSERAKIVTIHAAESEEEILFLHTGQGPLRDLLEERGMDPDRWQPPECGAITYLDRLGFLDGLSVCVHVVRVDAEEIHLLKNGGAAVCLCPRSNLFLGHGLPPVAQLLEAEISCGLGTDSLASNHDLNLFKEMAVLMDHCGIDPDAVLKMATHNGARNLGLAKLYGSLEKGKRWLAIRVEAKDLESIVPAGCQGALEWLR